MNTLLSDDIQSKTNSATLIKNFVKELEATGNADAMQELLEEKYAKDFKAITKRLDTDSTYALMDNIWENLIKYKKVIDEKSRENPTRQPEDLQATVEVILENTELKDTIFEGFMDLLSKKEESAEEISSKSFISSLKKQLGLDNREKRVKFLEKTESFFAQEQKPSLEDYLNRRTDNFNYCLMRILIDNLKSVPINAKSLKNSSGWQEKTDGNTTILQKIIKIEDEKEELANLELDSLLKEGEEIIRKATIEYNYPLLYELLVESDKVIKNIKKYSIKRKTKVKLEKSGNLENKVSAYFKIIREGGDKVTIESEKVPLNPLYGGDVSDYRSRDSKIDTIRYDKLGRRGKSRKRTKIQQEAIKLLLFSVKNQKESNFLPFFYKKDGQKYKSIPLFESIINNKINNKPVDSAINSMSFKVKVDETQFLLSWVRKKIPGESLANRNARRAKVKSIKAGIKDDEYEEAKDKFSGKGKKVVDGIQLAVFNTMNKYLREASFDKEVFDNNGWPIKSLRSNAYDKIGTTNVGVYINDDETRNKWDSALNNSRFMRRLRRFAPDVKLTETTLTVTRKIEEKLKDKDLGNRFSTSLEKGLAGEIDSLSPEESIDTLLTNDKSILETNKSSPTTLRKAIILTHHLARRYGQKADIVGKVKQIDTLRKEGLSIGDDRLAQAIVDLASLINEGSRDFANDFVKALEDKMDDIANNPYKYYNLYYSTFMEKLIRENILREVSE